MLKATRLLYGHPFPDFGGRLPYFLSLNPATLRILLLMRRFLSSAAICLLLSGMLLPQAAAAQGIGFKSYKTYEEYCFDNPKAPTCVNGKPLKMEDFNKGLLYKPRVVPRGPRVQTIQPMPPVTQTLQLRADWRFAHPGAELLAGIDVAALRQSQTVRNLLAKLAAEPQIAPAELDKMLAQASGVDQAWLSLRAGDFLLLLQGRLELPPGFVKLPNGMTSYRISNSAVVLGREESVAAAVQRLKGRTSAQASAALPKIAELSGANQLWFIGTAALIQQALKQAQPARPGTPTAGGRATPAPVTADLTGFSVGMRLRDGYHMDALLKFSSPAAARRMFASAGGSTPGFASPLHPSTPTTGAPGTPETLPRNEGAMKLTSGVEGSSVRVTLTIQQAELLGLVDKALASPGGQKLRDLAAAARRPSTISISGGGERPRQPDGSSRVVTVPSSPSQTTNGITIQGGASH